MFLGGRSSYVFSVCSRKCALEGSLRTFKSAEKDIIPEEPEFLLSECSGQHPHSLSLVEAYL